ncbi:hypothetical protein BN1805_03010 [Proteus vulgaris]|nr:hypothetical protein BN1805_03010 [Proteus vulgaris]
MHHATSPVARQSFSVEKESSYSIFSLFKLLIIFRIFNHYLNSRTIS